MLGGVWKDRRLALCALLLLAIGFSLNTGRTLYYKYFVYMDDQVGNIGLLPEELRISNEPLSKFITLNTEIYFGKPFWGVWNDDFGRQYLPNSLLKSSLFGDFQMEGTNCAIFLSAMLLWLIFYAFLNIIADLKYYAHRREWWICALPLIVGIVAIIRSRYNYPYGATQDFRYIYPVIMGCAAMLAMIYERQEQRGYAILCIVTAGSMLAFTAGSIYFYLGNLTPIF